MITHSLVQAKDLKTLILCLALVLSAAKRDFAQGWKGSGSDGSDGAYDLTGQPAGTIVNFTPSQFHGTGVSKGIYNFTYVTIPTSVTVKIAGNLVSAPVYWLAQTNVDVEGTIDLSGQAGANAAPNLAARTRPTPGAGGFSGGVGGKEDQVNPPPGEPVPQPGDGPAGGAPAGDTSPSCGGDGGGGTSSGNVFLVPLLGGSGGGGGLYAGQLGSTSYAASGGAGGGAILIASSTQITVNGTVNANGGPGGTGSFSNFCNGEYGYGGGGAGGGIRLAAPTVTGKGELTAVGGIEQGCGCGPTEAAPGGSGVVRLEAFTDSFTGSFNGTTESLGSPYATFVPATPPPTVIVTSVNGVKVTNPPSGSLTTPDVTIDTSSQVLLAVKASYVTVGTIITLHVFSDNDTDQTVQTTPLAGTLQSSSASATVTFPSGYALNYVKATWSQ